LSRETFLGIIAAQERNLGDIAGLAALGRLKQNTPALGTF